MRIVSLWVSAVFLALLAAAYAGAEGVPHYEDGLQLAGTIQLEEVEGRIDHMAASPDGRQLFVAALGSNMVEKIDTRQRTIVGNIHGIKEPHGLGYIPKSNRLVVASGGDGNVRIYDQNLKPVGWVNSLEDADNVRYDPAQDLFYGGYGQGSLAIIDPTKSVKIAEIPLDGHPESF